jgi:threonine dehydratase
MPIGGGGLAAGVSTLTKLLNPGVKVIGVEPAGAASMKAAMKAGHPVTLPTVSTIADGVAVKTVGDQVFPYVQANVDEIITIEDDELVDAFLDMMEKHKMVVENSGLLTLAALNHINCKGKNIVPILSGGNMDVITMSSLVQHGLIRRGRVFTFSVLLPDRPGELVRVAQIVSAQQGNIIKLDHNQFVSINRAAAVELQVTLEAFGHSHKAAIVKALEDAGYEVKIVPAAAALI